MAPRPIRANTLFYDDSLLILREYPKIQIRTIEQLLNGAAVEMPPEYGTFKQAQRVENDPSATQAQMDLGLDNG